MIARAMAASPKIIYFDESTSALDNRSQQIVVENLASRRITRVVVAHRLSTVRQADCIFVMDQGKVVQQGTFEELFAVEGLFRNLAIRQMPQG